MSKESHIPGGLGKMTSQYGL